MKAKEWLADAGAVNLFRLPRRTGRRGCSGGPGDRVAHKAAARGPRRGRAAQKKRAVREAVPPREHCPARYDSEREWEESVYSGRVRGADRRTACGACVQILRRYNSPRTGKES